MKNGIINLIYVGSIDKNKNITLTIQAIKILKQQGWTVNYIVVGKNADNKIFEKISQFISYYEQVDKKQLIYLYRKADVFVMPSLTETFGLVYAEAMSQGLPVVYSRNEGFDKQFNEGEVGYSVNKRSKEELVEVIEKIVCDYERISKNCKNMCEKFDWNNICEEYIKVYNSI